MPEAQHRRLAAIMFTDMVGYTAVMGEDEPKALRLLQKNRDLLRPIIQKFNGEWLKEMTVPSPLLPASWTRLTAPGFTQTSAPLQGRWAAPANCSCQARRGLLAATGSRLQGVSRRSRSAESGMRTPLRLGWDSWAGLVPGLQPHGRLRGA